MRKKIVSKSEIGNNSIKENGSPRRLFCCPVR